MEPQLKHVCMLTVDGLIPVEAEDVVRRYPDIDGSISSKKFICELCGKYVILVKGKKRRPFFKHNRGDEDKECPERAEGMRCYQDFLEGKYIPSIYCTIENNKAKFKIGINYELLKTYNKKSNILITVNEKKIFSYSLNERLERDRLTYLNVGEQLIDKIHIDVFDLDNKKINILPTTSVMNAQGMLFLYSNGRFLPYDSNIFVGEKYHYIGVNPIRVKRGVSIIKDEFIWIDNRKIYHQIIHIKNMLLELVRYFKHQLNYRLEKSIVTYIPVWPEYVWKDDQILVAGEHLYTLLYGNIKLLYRRNGTAKVQECNFVDLSNHDGYRFGKIKCFNYKSLIAVGRIRALDYAYLQKDVTPLKIEYPPITICDEEKVAIQDGVQEDLPKNKYIIIESEYDFMVKHTRKKWLLGTKKYCGKIKVNVNYDEVVEVYQGLDLRFRIEYRKQNKKRGCGDLYKKVRRQRGRKVPVDAKIREIGKNIRNDKRVADWIRKQNRLGNIDDISRRILLKKVREDYE